MTCTSRQTHDPRLQELDVHNWSYINFNGGLQPRKFSIFLTKNTSRIEVDKTIFGTEGHISICIDSHTANTMLGKYWLPPTYLKTLSYSTMPLGACTSHLKKQKVVKGEEWWVIIRTWLLDNMSNLHRLQMNTILLKTPSPNNFSSLHIKLIDTISLYPYLKIIK